jgi:hypothetical protein
MQVHGAVKGFFTCSKTFMLSVSSYQIEVRRAFFFFVTDLQW